MHPAAQAAIEEIAKLRADPNYAERLKSGEMHESYAVSGVLFGLSEAASIIRRHFADVPDESEPWDMTCDACNDDSLRQSKCTCHPALLKIKELEADLQVAEEVPAILRGEYDQLALRDSELVKELQTLRDALKEASDERYNQMQEWRAEADKWKSEDDWYGWNFFQGMSAGANFVDLNHGRVRRAIEALLARHAAKGAKP